MKTPTQTQIKLNNYNDNFKHPADAYDFAAWSLGWNNFKQHETVQRWNERHGHHFTINSLDEFFSRLPQIVDLWKKSRGNK